MSKLDLNRILVVDDSKFMRAFITIQLEAEGYVTTSVEDGRKALELAAAQNFDLVLLDLMMPGLSGIETLSILRQHYSEAELPVIMVTSSDDSQHIVEALSTGANDYIVKPIEDFSVVLARIHTQLSRKKAETALREALIKEQATNEMRARFISVVSHEFRTPLASIMVMSNILTQYHNKMTDSQRMQRLLKIQDVVRHITTLLDEFLLVGKGEMHKLDFKPEPTDLKVYTQEFIDELQKTLPSHTIQWQAKEPLQKANVDQKLLRQILTNLISNAAKYSTTEKPVVCLLHQDQEHSVFRIQDQGIGIPESDLPHLFEPFHRGKNVGTLPGTGLGLAIVKKAVEFHSGTLSVESTENEGTTVTVKLPIQLHPTTDAT
ncbi:MAG: hybrid sensor histidine kinase/response regulator [Deltaproteobacteria bacterium]|nr:MAG: hybrid sensor histidine kinase/response regulator [Deltaproteobacteria bacterium]